MHISSQLLRCKKYFLLAYTAYAARRNIFRALHLGELCIFRDPLLGNFSSDLESK